MITNRRTSLTVLGQPTVSYTYDNAGRLTQITQGTATVTLAYDTTNRRTSLTLPNGVVTEYGYDAASRLTGLTYKSGPNVLGTLTYAYDNAGNRAQVGGTWARTGLPQAVTSATYNAANHQLTFGGQALTYDLNGSLTSDGTTTYTWDARNRLASLTGGSATATFQYDPLGRRPRKVINGTTTDFLYDGVNPIQELSGGPAVVNLLTGLGIDEYFIRTDSAGTRALFSDALGSTVALTDPAGAVQTQYTYEPFGAVVTSGETNGNPYQYTGREHDAPTGLYYYRARYYHPGLARFISEDPIGFGSGHVNLYTYAGNEPIGHTDPLGLEVVYGRYRISNPELRRRLELLSERTGCDVIITGGDRSPAENRRVGGAPNSQHLAGNAADFRIEGMSYYSDMAELAARSGLFNGVGYYPPGSPLGAHVHVDLRADGSQPRWYHWPDADGQRWRYRRWHDRENIWRPGSVPLGARKDPCGS